MYFLISVPNERFHRVMCMRALQRRLGVPVSINRDIAELTRTINDSFGGRLVVLDWSSGEVLADFPVPGASGFAINGQLIFICSWIEHCVHILGGGRRLDRISHRWFNHLHSIELTPRNTLLIPSAGADLLLEVSMSGEIVYKWFAPEHGYKAASGGGAEFAFEDSTDYRQIRRSTAERVTHMTCALPMGNTILATLFHQGELISVDRDSGVPSVILEGLSHPHGIHRRPGGFLLSDTLGHRIILLDECLKLEAEISFGSQWLQDAIETSAGTYLALENVHIDQLPEPGIRNRIVELDRSGKTIRELEIPPNYRLFTVREIHPQLAQQINQEWGVTGELEFASSKPEKAFCAGV
jgi:hypothetical protein